MQRTVPILAIVLIILAATACAPGPNTAVTGADEAPGFWLGLWHGFITLFTFVVSLFNDNVSIYEVHNSGGWYNFGFLLGVMFFWGGGCGGTACRRKKG